jgi:acyl carrier protein
VSLDQWAVVAVVGVMLAAFQFFGHRRRKRHFAAFLADRDSLDEEAFAALFDTEAQAAVAVKLHVLLARHWPLDSGKLRPDDRFAADLRLDEMDSLASNAFVMDIERELGVAIPDEVAEHLLTFRQVVAYVAKKPPSTV